MLRWENEPTQTWSCRPALLDEAPQRLGRAGGLEVDVEVDVGPRVEHLGEQRHVAAVADLGVRHLGPRQVADPPVRVADPVEDGVVERDQLPVPRDVDVGLEVGVAQADGVAECGHGVLEPQVGCVERPAPVGQGHRSPLEVGPRRHHGGDAIGQMKRERPSEATSSCLVGVHPRPVLLQLAQWLAHPVGHHGYIDGLCARGVSRLPTRSEHDEARRWID